MKHVSHECWYYQYVGGAQNDGVRNIKINNITASWSIDDSKLTLNNITLNVDMVSNIYVIE